MTREEQIKNAALDHRKSLTASGYFSESECRMGQDGFYQGAEWADENPNWHKYPEDPPQIEDRYAIFTTDKSYITADYRNGHFVIEFHWGYVVVWDKEVIAWMELPQPPKFD